jgi:hypothetical protein
MHRYIYSLRTLLVLLAVLPPMMAGAWWVWTKVSEPHKQPSFDELIDLITRTIAPDSWDDVGGRGSVDAFSTMGCFILVEAEDDVVGPDPCGRSYSFRPYSKDDDDELPLLPVAEQLADDPFAVTK